MNDSHVIFLTTVGNELDRLVSCRRLMDADMFVDSLYTSVKLMDDKSGANLLSLIGDKPKTPMTFEVLCAFQKQIKDALTNGE